MEEAEILGEEFLEKVNTILHHPDCPQFYTRVGDRCLSVFFFGKVRFSYSLFVLINGQGVASSSLFLFFRFPVQSLFPSFIYAYMAMFMYILLPLS